MIPSLAWIISAYVIFRLIERPMALYYGEKHRDTAIAVMVAAFLAGLVVIFNLYAITSAAMQPTESPIP